MCIRDRNKAIDFTGVVGQRPFRHSCRRNCRKGTSNKTFCFPSLTNSKEFRYCIHEKGRHKKLLFFKYRRYTMEKHVRVDKPHLWGRSVYRNKRTQQAKGERRMILYFSGTGNSAYVARQLGELLQQETIDVFARIRDKDTTALQSSRPWIVVCPCLLYTSRCV